MKVCLKKAFNILDGRLSTKMGDVYEMLRFVFGRELFTHELPKAMTILEQENPPWFAYGRAILESIKRNKNTDDFNELMAIIDNEYCDFFITIEPLNHAAPNYSSTSN